MNRASPVELRKALETANTFAKAGIRFICVPVFDDKDHDELLAQVHQRMEKMIEEAEQ
jgi:hypothetical protein